MNNELRIGVNLAPVDFFESTQTILAAALQPGGSVALLTDGGHLPAAGTRHADGQYIDNASIMAGNHTIQFGGSLQHISVRP